MKKMLVAVLVAMTLLGMTGCTTGGDNKSETLTGSGKGYGGEITVTVTRTDGKITEVKVAGDQETDGIGTNAIEQLPDEIVKANGIDVDVVSGATVTSNAILYAVNNALDPKEYPYPLETETERTTVPAAFNASALFQGFGMDNSGRIGPGKDAEGISVYGINQVLANVVFDEDGKILALYMDQIETVTPNYDGDGALHFSGFPGQGGFNYDANHDETITGKTEDTEESFLTDITTWRTKRDRGDSYKMTSGTWSAQMDKYQSLFLGMTVAEVKDWYENYCSDINGRPLKAESKEEKDIEKYGALSDAEKEMLMDVVSGATMSVNDSHGNLVGAIVEAYENRVPIEVASIKGVGIGISNIGRVGPGKDENEVQIYSVNQVFANTLFDGDDRITAIFIDQLEYYSPNVKSETSPRFSGFPGQEAYGGERVPSEETFQSEISNWVTKRARGDDYKMTTGTWVSQMDGFQKIFIGKTVEEVEVWFDKYCSDKNGRPLKEDSTEEADITKYSALTDDEKTMLADVVSGATMSLNDSHGDIVAAIRNSFENKSSVDIAIKLED